MIVSSSNKKTKDLCLIYGIYLLAFAIAAAVAAVAGTAATAVLVFDVVATVVVFIGSVALHNSSVYDPYWSVTPMVIAAWLYCRYDCWDIWHIVVLVALFAWGIRLTLNWQKNTTGLDWEDWRYRNYRDNNGPFMWFILNFFGIHMMPTLLVFAGLIPLMTIVTVPLNAWCLVGVAIMLGGALLEHLADTHMRAFLQATKDSKERTTCRTGIWRLSRHPNYLGEITFWWGLAAVYFSASPVVAEPLFWVKGLGGAVAMFLLFECISIPLMEKRQLARRSDYRDYQRTTSRLFLLPPRK